MVKIDDAHVVLDQRGHFLWNPRTVPCFWLTKKMFYFQKMEYLKNAKT